MELFTPAGYEPMVTEALRTRSLCAISMNHLDDGNIRLAVETALEACKHYGPEGEPPDLRDARINLILKVSDYARTAMDSEDFEVLQALLERRIFNFLQRGDDFAERKRFPWLFPYGEGMFDGGRDRPLPISLDEYVLFMLQRADAWAPMFERLHFVPISFDQYIHWMLKQIAAVKTEVNRRRLPIGTAVRLCGLKNASDLNGCRGVVVGFQQQRFQIKFAQREKKPKAVLPANLEIVKVDIHS